MSTLRRRLFAELPREITIVLFVPALIVGFFVLGGLMTLVFPKGPAVSDTLASIGIPLVSKETLRYYWERRLGILLLVGWFLGWIYIPLIRYLTNFLIIGLIVGALFGGRRRRW